MNCSVIEMKDIDTGLKKYKFLLFTELVRFGLNLSYKAIREKRWTNYMRVHITKYVKT